MKTKRFVLFALLIVVALALSATLVGAQDDNVIKIASQGPLSGGQSPSGTGLRNSVELAIEELKQPLVDMGYDVQYVPFDDQATADVGVANANR